VGSSDLSRGCGVRFAGAGGLVEPLRKGNKMSQNTQAQRALLAHSVESPEWVFITPSAMTPQPPPHLAAYDDGSSVEVVDVSLEEYRRLNVHLARDRGLIGPEAAEAMLRAIGVDSATPVQPHEITIAQVRDGGIEVLLGLLKGGGFRGLGAVSAAAYAVFHAAGDHTPEEALIEELLLASAIRGGVITKETFDRMRHEFFENLDWVSEISESFLAKHPELRSAGEIREEAAKAA